MNVAAAMNAAMSRNLGSSSSMPRSRNLAMSGEPSGRSESMPNDTAPDPTPEALFGEASQGRKQAALAGARLESHLYRCPDALSGLRSAAFAYLSGVDLTVSAGSVQEAGQAIIRRLNDALDGHGRRVTSVLLTAEAIASLRTFRHQVRQLMSAPPTTAGTVAGPFGSHARGLAHDGRTQTAG